MLKVLAQPLGKGQEVRKVTRPNHRQALCSPVLLCIFSDMPFFRFAFFLLLLVGSIFAFLLKTRQIPFDSTSWQGGDPSLRFRMKDSLVSKYEAGDLSTLEAVNRLLDPNGGSRDNYDRIRLSAWDGPWYLRIDFDEQNNVTHFAVYPD